MSAVDPLDPIVTPNEMASCFCWPHVFIEGARKARGFGKRRAQRAHFDEVYHGPLGPEGAEFTTVGAPGTCGPKIIDLFRFGTPLGSKSLYSAGSEHVS